MHPELRAVPIFAGLSETALDLLLTRAERTVVPPGSVILREGEPGNRFYLIVAGDVKVVKNFGSAHEVSLAVLPALSFFGEMCILETLPRSASVISTSTTTLLSLPAVAFYHLFQQAPDQYGLLLLNIARDLSRRLRDLDETFAARH